jgi:GNAT superfamily N-acetyltransferase
MASFDIRFESSASLHPDGNPDHYVTTYRGRITAYGLGDDDFAEAFAGRVLAYRIHADLADAHGVSLFDVCDCHSDEMLQVYDLLYRQDRFERYGACQADVLVLDYVVLDPRWRGLKLGLMAVRAAIDRLGHGCGLAVSHIAPLVRDAHRKLEVPARWIPPIKSAVAEDDAAVRLRRYFRRMGFRRVKRTGHYYLPLHLVAPSARDLLKASPAPG